MSIGKRIRKRRESIDMLQIDLAEKAEISKQTLYKYENEIITNIPSDKIERLAAALNVSPAYLMGWEDESENLKPLDSIEGPDEVKELIRHIQETDWSPEEIEQIQTFINFVRSQNNEDKK